MPSSEISALNRPLFETPAPTRPPMRSPDEEGLVVVVPMLSSDEGLSSEELWRRMERLLLTDFNRKRLE